MCLPVLTLLLSTTHSAGVVSDEGLQFTLGTEGLARYVELWQSDDLFGNGVTLRQMVMNSMIVAIGIACIQTVFSVMAAFALVYFRVPFAGFLFGIMILSMFFPVETRVIPTFLVARDLGLLNSYAGMILPVAASGLGVLIFQQYFRQIPDELHEAARIDGAGPLKFLWDILVPLSWPMMAALFTLLFVVGWNQYVWPIVINTTSEDHYTLVRGIERAGRGSRDGMALAILAILPPGIVMLLAQRWITHGLNLSTGKD